MALKQSFNKCKQGPGNVLQGLQSSAGPEMGECKHQAGCYPGFLDHVDSSKLALGQTGARHGRKATMAGSRTSVKGTAAGCQLKATQELAFHGASCTHPERELHYLVSSAALRAFQPGNIRCLQGCLLQPQDWPTPKERAYLRENNGRKGRLLGDCSAERQHCGARQTAGRVQPAGI